MISLHRIDHVALRVADPDEAARRWSAEFGLTIRERSPDRVRLACDDEPYALELIAGEPPGLDHVAYELAPGCPPEQARAHLVQHGHEPYPNGDGDGDGAGAGAGDAGGDGDVLRTADPDGNAIELRPFREPASRLTPHARPAGGTPVGHPLRLGHVNFLTGALADQLRFYTEVLGMRITDWLGDGGVWLHIDCAHHVMALIDKGAAQFHHLAFELTDIGQLRTALDHLGRHGRWLGWGPVRHGVGGNIAAYVRVVPEVCFVELYCDMEQLRGDHRPRRWPDNRYSSNTWGPLPPRSYFRFDPAAIESERESLEMLGVPLPPAPDSGPPGADRGVRP